MSVPSAERTKHMNQTKLTSYFTGCCKLTPLEKKPVIRRKRSCNRLSLSSSTMSETNKRSLQNISKEVASLIAGIPKRKLPAPIFSDDEDSESDIRKIKSPKRNLQSNNTETFIALNKPTPCCETPSTANPTVSTVESESNKSGSIQVSTTLSSSSCENPDTRISTVGLENDVPINNKSETVQVLQNIVLQSPENRSFKIEAKNVNDQIKNSPHKSAQKKQRTDVTLKANSSNQPKDDVKKVNYEQLRVIREFFIHILKNSHLLSLFSTADKEFLFNFFDIEKNYQYVCIKLFLWKPIWYNIFKYIERIGLSMTDSEINDMYNFLKDKGFVDTEYMVEDSFTLLDLLNLKEIRDIGRSFRLVNVAGSKETIISRLLKIGKTQATLTHKMNSDEILRERIKEKMGFCVKLSSRLSRCIYSVYLLNTFTNSTLLDPQDYFTNVSYFNTVFPTFNVENFNVFYTPQEFARYADAIKMRTELDTFIAKRSIPQIFEICRCAYTELKKLNDELGNSFDTSRQPYLEKFTPNAQYIQILSHGSTMLTTTYFDQVKIWLEYLLSQGFCNHKRGNWYTQLLLIYTSYVRDYETAAKLLIKAFKEEKEHFSDIQLQELAHRGKMLNRKTYKLPQLFHDEIAALSPSSCDRAWPQDIVDGISIPSEQPGRKRIYVHRDENGDTNYLTVEQTALQYYQSMGYPNGQHCEGSLIVASFCLLFWDIMYDVYVKGTFVSSVQNSPLDMYTKYFYINRETKINKRLRSIKESWDDETLKKKLFANWTSHSHEKSLCSIDAAVDGPKPLYEIILCIGRPIIARIFERLANNFRLYHSGLPDLILWNLKEKKAKLVEVKSENDTISIKQKLWLNYLIDIGASVAVCHVESKGSKKKLAARN